MVGKWYIKVQGWLKVPKGPRLENGTYWSKVGNRYLKVKGWQKAPKGPRLQSVPSWLELELAQAKSSRLAGSAQRQSQNPSLARLGLEQVLNFRAELVSSSGFFVT